MGHKIFVSYKYADNDVKNLNYFEDSTVRDYVTELERKLGNTNHIYKGESDGEDLSNLSDDAIWKSLKDRIYDSSLTIVFISPNMKEGGKLERNQWIPWEISYSLKENTRKNEAGQSITSKTNAMLAVVLPDQNDSYAYYLNQHSCCFSTCVTHHTDRLFKILRENKFNQKEKILHECRKDSDKKIYSGECSYIKAVKWDNFINNIDFYIDEAYERQANLDDYDIHKDL